MTAFNTNFNNTELLDQELTIEELEAVAGGLRKEVLEGAFQEVREAIDSITA